MDHYYPLFQDVNVMIFVGFGKSKQKNKYAS